LLSEWKQIVKRTAEETAQNLEGKDRAEMGRSGAAPLRGRVAVELGRRYRFAASHRLHTDALSEEENARVFGKCNNPYGHGHNYVLEIAVSGKIDEATGMIANLAELDAFVEREVLAEFDHRSLNQDVAVFHQIVPTTENLCIEIYRRLKKFPGARLERVRVQETSNNSFEYAGESGRERP
jgi:6-pyruvoyltetrahydropterin/6-carboxytetrahydropterin synthase